VDPLRTLAVWCADWPVVAAGRPPSAPVVVLHANRVVAAGAAARAHGVAVGLRRREAQSRCPSIELHEHDPARDARAFEPVLAALEELAPRIEITEPGRCALPTRGPSRYHGGDRRLAELALTRVCAAVPGVDVGVGIADGPRVAALAAYESLVRHHGARPLVVPPGAAPSFLAPLPTTHLGLVGADDELVDVLRRLGLRTLGRFAALPVPDVLARFGPPGADAHTLAAGRERRPALVRDPPEDLAVAMDLDPPADRVDHATFAAKALADELHDRLGGLGLACRRVLVVAETELGERIERWWRHDGTLSAAAVAQRARWQLEGWLGSGRTVARSLGAVTHLALVPDEVVPGAGRQLGFWGERDGLDDDARRAVDRVRGLLGEEAVCVPEWRGGRAPGERYRLVPAGSVDLGDAEARVDAVDPGPEPWPGAVPTPSPAVVPPNPLPAELLDDRGRRVAVSGRGDISASPSHCDLPGSGRVAVRSWAGPWCTEERWWDAIGHRRRARVQVVLADGTAHLLALESGSWWLEASYD
jgi:protein ImuB